MTERLTLTQMPCHITHTNEAVHELIRAALASRANVQRSDQLRGRVILSAAIGDERRLVARRQNWSSTLS